MDFIRKCLEKNPLNRISIVRMLDHPFIYQKDSQMHSHWVAYIRRQKYITEVIGNTWIQPICYFYLIINISAFLFPIFYLFE